MLKRASERIGFSNDLSKTYDAFQEALQYAISRRLARFSENADAAAVQHAQQEVVKKFKFQKFFCTGILLKHAKIFRERLAKSGLPFASNEITRIQDREDKFARRIFTTKLGDHRTRVSIQVFRLSRAYFFGLLQRGGRDEQGKLKMYPCLITNKKGNLPMDPHVRQNKRSAHVWPTLRPFRARSFSL